MHPQSSGKAQVLDNFIYRIITGNRRKRMSKRVLPKHQKKGEKPQRVELLKI